MGENPSFISDRYADVASMLHSTVVDPEPIQKKETIVILGTGDYGRALETFLTSRGINVVIGSRNPEKHSEVFPKSIVLPTLEALTHGSIVCLAIPVSGFSSLDSIAFRNKIVIDVSNRKKARSKSNLSQAETLQEHLPWSRVVKAFNTVSAYALQSGQFQGTKEVPICSNHSESAEKVTALLRKLGFSPINYGELSNAKDIEDLPFAFFPEWKVPGIICLSLFIVIYIYIVFRRAICPNIDRLDEDKDWRWQLFYSIPSVEVEKALGNTSLIILSCCYIPGLIASYVQLYRGTKYSRFPNWLDNWLKMRKALGLLALLTCLMHVLYAMTIIVGNVFPRQWRAYCILSSGILAATTMSILGVTSLPSVGASLTWREFSFIHRYLGWWCLFIASFHVIFVKWKKLIEDQFQCVVLPDEDQIILFIPLLSLLFKSPFLLPFVNSYLMKIRRGYERPRKGHSVR